MKTNKVLINKLKDQIKSCTYKKFRETKSRDWEYAENCGKTKQVSRLVSHYLPKIITIQFDSIHMWSCPKRQPKVTQHHDVWMP